jgi:hypothetical protein
LAEEASRESINKMEREMKKAARMVDAVIIAIAMALMITFCGVPVPVASRQACCTTPETQSVKTVVLISCRGMVSETEKVNFESSNEDLTNSPPLQDREVIGRIGYRGSLKVTNGETQFVKDTGVDTGGSPNFDVMKSVGYNHAGTIGSLSLDEDAGMSIAANRCPREEEVLCPCTAIPNLSACCEDVKASSRMVVTDVLATTRSEVRITDSPVSLHCSVTATGSGGADTLAHGCIAAQFSAYALEGSTENVDMYALASRMTYNERSSAHGLWQFHAEMDYRSRVKLP